MERLSCDEEEPSEQPDLDEITHPSDAERWFRATQAKLKQIQRSLICSGERSGAARARGCRAFAELKPRRAPAVGETLQGKPKECGTRAEKARCVEAAEGFYVPVTRNLWALCAWALWFVPKDGSEPFLFRGRELTMPVYEHGGEDETGMYVRDLDGDGKAELVLERNWTEDDDRGESGSDVVLARADGTVIKTPFHGVTDVDGDGALDVVLNYSFDDEIDSDSDWVRFEAPRLVLHRTRAGLSLQDEVARNHRRASCEGAIDVPIIALNADGTLDEPAMFLRALCQAADGAVRPILATVREVCAWRDSEFVGPTTRACRNGSIITRALESLEEVRLWARADR